ncbi:hypothetical protein ACWDUL_08690 [Nocardia niigatensis]
MSESSNREVTLAIRIDTARHTQLTWIAELRGTSLKAECFGAVDAWIEAAKSDPDLMARANAARAAIEEEARARQSAIDNLFTATPPPPPDDDDDETPIAAIEAVPEESTFEERQPVRRSRTKRTEPATDGETTES